MDRKRASARSGAVAQVMTGVDFTKAMKALPPYCLALMQNVSPEDQDELRKALNDLEERAGEPSVKSLLLGIELINVVGVDVLTTAVKSLGEQIRLPPEV